MKYMLMLYFQKRTCKNIRNAKQYENLSAWIAFFPWLLHVIFAISVAEAYRLQ